MPLLSTVGTARRVASSVVAVRQNMTPPSDTAVNSRVVHVLGLPRISIWLNQTVGGTGAAIQPQFQVRRGLPGVPEWLSLGPAFVLTPAVPIVLNFTFPAIAVRVQITRATGVTTTVQLAIGASMGS